MYGYNFESDFLVLRMIKNSFVVFLFWLYFPTVVDISVRINRLNSIACKHIRVAMATYVVPRFIYHGHTW